MHSGNIVIQVIFKTVYAHIAQFEKYRKPLYGYPMASVFFPSKVDISLTFALISSCSNLRLGHPHTYPYLY